MEPEANRASWIWTAAAGIMVVGLAVAGMRGEPARSQETGKPARRKTGEAVAPGKISTPKPERADPSFERYRGLLHRNPFAPRLPAPRIEISPVAPAPPVLPPAGTPVTEKPKEEVKKPETAPPVAAPAPPDPLKDWTYTGTVVFGDEIYAVLENKASKRGEYVKSGGNFEGWTVELIAQSELRLNRGGGIRALSKSSAFNATPLNAPSGAPGGAPGGPGGTGAPPAPGGPGTPGAPGGAGPRPGGPPMPAGTRPAAASAPAAAPDPVRVIK